MNATTKTIPIEDWYAPAFTVRLNAPKCDGRPSARRSVTGSRMLHTAHRGPCGTRPVRRIQRLKQFALLGHA